VTKRIITDRPELLGYQHGLSTGHGERVFRESDLPESQRADYRKSFKCGVRHGINDSRKLDEEENDD
jgi:hypothetical protein